MLNFRLRRFDQRYMAARPSQSPRFVIFFVSMGLRLSLCCSKLIVASPFDLQSAWLIAAFVLSLYLQAERGMHGMFAVALIN